MLDIGMQSAIGSTSEGTGMTMTGGCPYCSGPNSYVVHGGKCPKVKAFEYHPNGTLKRVEFYE